MSEHLKTLIKFLYVKKRLYSIVIVSYKSLFVELMLRDKTKLSTYYNVGIERIKLRKMLDPHTWLYLVCRKRDSKDKKTL